ncbi:unnamed protein product, partial [Discosporangium mesarthrocarpum]
QKNVIAWEKKKESEWKKRRTAGAGKPLTSKELRRRIKEQKREEEERLNARKSPGTSAMTVDSSLSSEGIEMNLPCDPYGQASKEWLRWDAERYQDKSSPQMINDIRRRPQVFDNLQSCLSNRTLAKVIRLAGLFTMGELIAEDWYNKTSVRKAHHS